MIEAKKIGEIWRSWQDKSAIRHKRSGFTLIELLVASLIVSVVMLVAWSGLISLMNMSAMAEARTLRQVEINRALDFLTDELRTARNINATVTNQVDSATDIADLLTAEGFNLDDLGSYGDLALYLELPASNALSSCANPAEFDRVIYDVRPSSDEWLGPRTLMRYGRIKSLDGSFDPCAPPIASDPIADALTDDDDQLPNDYCSEVNDVLTGGAGFYTCQDGERTNLLFQHTLVDTTVVPIETAVTSRLQSIQPKTLANVGCQNKDRLHALESERPARLQIVNQSATAAKVYAITGTDAPPSVETINGNSTWEKDTFETHPWVVTDLADTCQFIYVPDAAENQAIIDLPSGIGGAELALDEQPEANDSETYGTLEENNERS